MPSFSDYLWQKGSGNALSVLPTTWVRIVNNVTGAAYVSTAATDANGLYTFNNVPSGQYTMFTGPTNTGTWTTTGDAAYRVADTEGTFNVIDFGAKGDVQTVTDGVMNGSTGVLTSASNKFVAGDVGKRIIVLTAGGSTRANPTVAISGADGGAGATTLPTGSYTFVYTWIAGDGGNTLVGTSSASYSQTVANHIITLTVPALPSDTSATRIYCTVAPGGAFTGYIGTTGSTTFAYTTGLVGAGPAAATVNTTGIPLSTTIASFQNAGQVTLTASSTSATTAATVYWGTDDSAAALAAVAAAAAAGTGIVFVPPAATGYIWNSGITINNPRVLLVGPGYAEATIFYTGSGDCVRYQTSPFVNATARGWRIQGLTLNGYGAGAGASGLHYGDIVEPQLIDLKIQKFMLANSVGLWEDNRTNWTERALMWRVNLQHNTINWLIDRVIGVGDVSHAHAHILAMTQDIGPPYPAVGIQLQNGSILSGFLNVTGNVDTQSTTIKVMDTANLGYFNSSLLFDVALENSGVGLATGLNVAAGASIFGSGVIDLAAGLAGMYTNVNSGGTNIQFSGRFNVPGIYTPAGESLVVWGTGARIVGTSRITADTVALQLQRTAGALGGLVGFADQAGTVKARLGISAVDNSFLMDDGTTNFLTSAGGGAITFPGVATTAKDLILGTAPRLLTSQATAPTVGSPGAGVSAQSVVAGGTNTALQVQATLTAVAPGVVIGVVAFNGGPLATAPKHVVCSLSAPTAGVASPPIVGADTYTTSGFTVRSYGPTTVTTGTYIVTCHVFF